jgi:glycosyltransferase involved in cell wall biosynthesis
MERISVIIPVYNSGQFLVDTIKSIQDQTVLDWECIFVDDGSQDESLSILDDFALLDSRISVYRRPSNMAKGGNSCRNYGFMKSTGAYIQWFDSDDLMLPTMLERKRKRLQEQPELDFVVSKMGTLDNGTVRHVDYPIDSGNTLEDFLSYNIRFLTPGPLFRREFLSDKSLFSTTLHRHQEWEFFSRLLILGSSFGTMEEFHCLRRIHGTSLNQVYEQKPELDRRYAKLLAVDTLNEKTFGEKTPLLFKIFFRKMAYAILLSIRLLEYSKFRYFSVLFIRFAVGSMLRIKK